MMSVLLLLQEFAGKTELVNKILKEQVKITAGESKSLDFCPNSDKPCSTIRTLITDQDCRFKGCWGLVH
jgi:hypothetical protein